jgi:hypothetical protein
MKSHIRTKPTRRTWREFCEEPQLTDEELKQLLDCHQAMSKDIELEDAVLDATEEEWQATQAHQPADDWTDMVKSADARRRYNRAVIKTTKSLINLEEKESQER